MKSPENMDDDELSDAVAERVIGWFPNELGPDHPKCFRYAPYATSLDHVIPLLDSRDWSMGCHQLKDDSKLGSRLYTVLIYGRRTADGYERLSTVANGQAHTLARAACLALLDTVPVKSP